MMVMAKNTVQACDVHDGVMTIMMITMKKTTMIMTKMRRDKRRTVDMLEIADYENVIDGIV